MPLLFILSGIHAYAGQAGELWDELSLDIEDVAASESAMVVVGGPDLLTSLDGGSTWTPQFLDTLEDFSSISFLRDTFLAINSDGAFISSDGLDWSLVSDNVPALTSVAYNGVAFVGIERSRVFQSVDGLSWTHTDTLSHRASDLLWTGSRFVAVGQDGGCSTSADGLAWTRRSVPTLLEIHSIDRSDTLLVAVGQTGCIFSSENGVSWKREAVPAGVDFDLRDVVWTGQRFIVVGERGILSSMDGTEWKLVDHGLSEPFPSAIASSGNSLVAVGKVGLVVRSADGLEWVVTQHLDCKWRAIVWTGAQFLAVGDDAAVAISPDGFTWTKHSLNSSVEFADVAWSGERFVATTGHSVPAGAVPLPYASTDGIQWTEVSDRSTLGMGNIVWAETMFVGVRGRDSYSSPDGLSWQLNSSVLPRGGVMKLIWTGEVIVAITSLGAALVSADGISWMEHVFSDDSTRMFDGTWTGEELIVVGDRGRIYSSPDGSTWSRLNSGTTTRLRAVTSVHDTVFAFGLRSVLSSSDGVQWQTTSTDLSEAVAATWSGSRLVALGRSMVAVSQEVSSLLPMARLHSATVGEGDSPVEVLLTLDGGGALQDVSFACRTADGTAKADEDYVGRSGRITIPTGQTAVRIPIEILDDSVVEGSESFRLILQDPIGLEFANDQIDVVIRDGGQGYDGWALIHGLPQEEVSPGHDSNRDGVQNGINYALRIGPRAFLAGQHPDLIPRIEQLEPTSAPEYVFWIPLLLPRDVLLHVQSSPDGMNWTTLGSLRSGEVWNIAPPTSLTVNAVENGYQEVSVSTGMPVSVSPQALFRIAVDLGFP